MSQSTITGGAAPSLAAHSKDASTPGPTPASAAAPEQKPSSDRTDRTEDSDSGARSSMGASVSDAVHAIREFAPTAGEAREFLRDQSMTMTALVVTGVACFLIGLLIGRR